MGGGSTCRRSPSSSMPRSRLRYMRADSNEIRDDESNNSEPSNGNNDGFYWGYDRSRAWQWHQIWFQTERGRMQTMKRTVATTTTSYGWSAPFTFQRTSGRQRPIPTSGAPEPPTAQVGRSAASGISLYTYFLYLYRDQSLSRSLSFSLSLSLYLSLSLFMYIYIYGAR